MLSLLSLGLRQGCVHSLYHGLSGQGMRDLPGQLPAGPSQDSSPEKPQELLTGAISNDALQLFHFLVWALLLFAFRHFILQKQMRTSSCHAGPLSGPSEK